MTSRSGINSLRPSSPRRKPLPDPAAAALAEVFASPRAGSAFPTKGRRKKPQGKPVALFAGAATAIVAIGFAGLWLAFQHDNPPSDGEVAKAAASANSVKPLPQVSPKPAGLSKDSRVAGSTEPTPQRQENVQQTTPEPESPESKSVANTATTATTPIVDQAGAAKTASGDSPAAKPEPNEPEAEAPAKKLAPPAAEEQKRLLGEIDEVYKPSAPRTVRPRPPWPANCWRTVARTRLAGPSSS